MPALLCSCSQDPWWEDAMGDEVATRPQPSDPLPADSIDESWGCELWQDYVRAAKAGDRSVLLDYSYAGYACGERDIPDADYRVYDVTDFGAVANDDKSDRQALVSAIAAAVASKQSAIVYFPEGRFIIRDSNSENSSIVIDGDNIVLRGAGSGKTTLAMSAPNQPLDHTLWNTPELITFTRRSARADDKLLLTKVCGEARKGSHKVDVASASHLFPGQRVLLKATCNEPEAVKAEVAPYSVESEWKELTQEGVKVTEYLQVLRVSGRTIEFKQPLMHDIDPSWGWTIHAYDCHTGCGVEDITFEGNFTMPFNHHGSALDDSGYRALTFHRQADGWIRRCRFINVSEAASVMLSCNVSVTDCSIDGNGGHSAIRAQASSHTLLARISDNAGQYHSVGVSKTSIGTVILQASIAPSSCFESHSSQPRATLIDNCSGGMNPFHAGGDAAAGPNHLADLTLWNYRETGGPGGTMDLWVRNNRFLMPIIAGYQGNTSFMPQQVTADLSHGCAVEPRSLYLAQLNLRLMNKIH